jgi:hypothetical protein
MNRQRLHDIGVSAMREHAAGARWEMDEEEREEYATTGALFNSMMRRVLDAYEENGLRFMLARELRELEQRPRDFVMRRIDKGGASVIDTGPNNLQEKRVLEICWTDHREYRYCVTAQDPDVRIETAPIN